MNTIKLVGGSASTLKIQELQGQLIGNDDYLYFGRRFIQLFEFVQFQLFQLEFILKLQFGRWLPCCIPGWFD